MHLQKSLTWLKTAVLCCDFYTQAFLFKTPEQSDTAAVKPKWNTTKQRSLQHGQET